MGCFGPHTGALLVEDSFRIPNLVSYGLNSSTGRYEQRWAVVTVIVCTLLRKNIASSKTVKKRKRWIGGRCSRVPTTA